MSRRKAAIKRTTQETDISVNLELDATGQYKVKTGIPFLDHMLSLFTRHGLFYLEVEAKGDLEVDIHHTNEDVGICLGEAFKKALEDKKGIKRFGTAYVPMDEAIVRVVLDISGRPSLHLKTETGSSSFSAPSGENKGYTFEDAKQFLQAFVINSGINMHVSVLSGEDEHHVLEALFKALGKALDEATRLDERIKDIPSTKGTL